MAFQCNLLKVSESVDRNLLHSSLPSCRNIQFFSFLSVSRQRVLIQKESSAMVPTESTNRTLLTSFLQPETSQTHSGMTTTMETPKKDRYCKIEDDANHPNGF